MSTGPPFIDADSGSLDTAQIKAEAFPLAGLIALFTGLGLVPYVFVFFLGGASGLGVVFAIVGQFVFAVGAGIVLMYVVARAVQLAE